MTSTYAWPRTRRGGERYLHELARGMAGRGHDVLVLTSAPAAGAWAVWDVPVTAVRRRAGGRRRLGPHVEQLWFGAQVLPGLLRRPPDVWHALTLGDGLAAGLAGRVRSTRSVYTALGVPSTLARTPVSAFVHRQLVRTVDEYVCLSERAAAALREHHAREPAVVGAGTDLGRFRPGTRNHVPAVLFASDLDAPAKQADLFLDACERLVRRRPELEIWLAGPGDVEARLRGRPPALTQRVTLRRRVAEDELVARYGAAWATVLPSRNEAFGMVALESLACGTPAVVLEGEGPAGFVTPACGVRTEPTAPALADAVEEALALAARPGTVAACRAAAAEHDWTAVVPRLERLYGV